MLRVLRVLRVLCVLPALDRFKDCKRFVIQDEAQTVGLCLDVYEVNYKASGELQLDVGFLHQSRGNVTGEIVKQLQAVSPGNGERTHAHMHTLIHRDRHI